RVHRRRLHLYQHLVFSGPRPFHLREFHHLFISVTLDPHCFHDFSSCSWLIWAPQTRFRSGGWSSDNCATACTNSTASYAASDARTQRIRFDHSIYRKRLMMENGACGGSRDVNRKT